MAANAAGAVQEGHHGAVWWRKPDFRAAHHPCCPRFLVGIPLQTMTNLPYKVLIALLLISRSCFLPSSGKQECLAKLSLHVLDLKTSSLWSQTKATPCFELKAAEWFTRDIITSVKRRRSPIATFQHTLPPETQLPLAHKQSTFWPLGSMTS